MKNGRYILLFVIALSVSLVLGVFIGRNTSLGHEFLLDADSMEKSSTSGEDMDYRLDVNIASKAQLMELPGIGEVMAERIIDYRSEHGNFSSIDDLLNIEGIGEKKLLQIEKLITVGG